MVNRAPGDTELQFLAHVMWEKKGFHLVESTRFSASIRGVSVRRVAWVSSERDLPWAEKSGEKTALPRLVEGIHNFSGAHSWS